MIARPLALAALLCFAAAPLAAQGSNGRLSGRFPATDVQRLGALIDSFAVAGAPEDPLVLKAIEGASKGASAGRVENALRDLGAALLQAREALGPAADPRDVTAGAGALRAGARPAALASLRGARPSGSLAVPLGTLADLLARGVAVERAEQVIVQLAARKAGDAEFGQVAGSVAEAAGGRRSATPGQTKAGKKMPPGPPAGVPGNGGRSDPPGKANGNSGNPGNTGKPPNTGSPPSGGGNNGKGRGNPQRPV